MFGDDAYPELELKAAAMMTSLSRNHALFDGNKRFSWFLTMAFFRLNGYLIVMTNDEMFDLVLATTQATADLPEIAEAFRTHLKPLQ